MASRKQNPFIVRAYWHFCFCCILISARSQTDTLQQGQQLNGSLKIAQNGSSPICLKANQGSVRTLAILTDRRNLVSREVNSDGSAGDKVLWQSLVYPTDMLFTQWGLGFSFKTGQNWSLTSWVNYQVPAQRAFMRGADPHDTAQLVMWRRGEIHWSGIWHDKRFENFKDYVYRFEYVKKTDERYFVFSAVENWYFSFSFLMFQIGGKGGIRMSGLRREGMQTNTVISGRSQNVEWCVEQKLPECKRGKWFVRSKGFVVSDGVKLDDRKYILGLSDCEAACLNNCSCVAYASIYLNGTGCELWSHMTQLVEDGYQGYREFYIQQEAKVKASKKFLWIWLIVATAGTLFLLSLAWLGYHMQRKLLQVTRFFWMLGYFVVQSLKANLEKLYYHVQENLEAIYYGMFNL